MDDRRAFFAPWPVNRCRSASDGGPTRTPVVRRAGAAAAGLPLSVRAVADAKSDRSGGSGAGGISQGTAWLRRIHPRLEHQSLDVPNRAEHLSHVAQRTAGSAAGVAR